MNKKILAAALGVAFAGLAQAQSSVVLYGRIDAALQVAKTPNGTLSNLTGSESGTRWGVRGSEFLGDNMYAIFNLESGFDESNGKQFGSSLFDRISTVGLKGNFGKIELGLSDTPLFNVLDAADPFGSSTTASLQYSLWAAGASGRGYDRRFKNGFLYTSPNFSGFQFQGVYSLGEQNTQNGQEDSRGNTAGLSLTYANGPAFLGYAYNRTQVDSSFGTGSLSSVITGVTPHKYQAIAGSYDFSVVKIYGAYYTDKQNLVFNAPSTQINQRVYWLGLSAPVGAMSSVALNVGKVNDKNTTDRDANQWGVGYFYNLSKRTYLYSTYGSITNKNVLTSGGSVVSPIVTTSANGLANNSGKSGAYDFGLVHKF